MGDLQNELKEKVMKEETKHDKPTQKEEQTMIKFYKDGALDPVLVSSKAEAWASEFFPNPQYKSDKSNLSSAQIRRFYGEVLSIEEKLSTQNDFNLIYPQILMLKSKAAYASNPSNRKIPDSFKNWIFQMVDSIKNEEDFKAFKLTFEAIVGFFYGKGAK